MKISKLKILSTTYCLVVSLLIATFSKNLSAMEEIADELSANRQEVLPVSQDPIDTLVATTELLRTERNDLHRELNMKGTEISTLKKRLSEVADELFGANKKELDSLIAPHFPKDGWLEIIKSLYHAGFSSNGESHVNWKFQDIPHLNWSQEVKINWDEIVNWSCGCGCERTRRIIQKENWEEVKIPHNKANLPFNKMVAIYGEFFKDMPEYQGKYVKIGS